MGMYDHVMCKMPLPDGWAGEGMQTKCGVRNLDLYIIEENGVLLHQPWATNEPHEEPFTGWFNFYGFEDDEVTKPWHEYMAKIVDGKCLSIMTFQDYQRSEGCPRKRNTS